MSKLQLIVGSCAVVVALSLGMSAWTFVRQSQADTIRTADKKSQSISTVAQCLQQVENSPKVLKILELVDILASNSITANQQALDATGKDDPLRKTREDSIKRLIPARDDLRRFIAETKRIAPTRASCLKLAVQLGVDTSKLK